MNETVRSIVESNGFDKNLLSQIRAIETIESPFKESWVVIYDGSGRLPDSLRVFACLAATELEDEILSGFGWIKRPNWFCPGFVQEGDRVVYESACDDGYEFIVASQDFYALDEEQFVVNHEFILLLKLYRGSDGNYYSVDESGKKEVVVEISARKVRVRTRHLIRYMSAKRLLFVQFVDSRVSSEPGYPNDVHVISHQDVKGESWNCFIDYRTNSKKDYLFSMIQARSVVRPRPVEESGIWPFEVKDTSFPEFCVEELPDGTLRRFTCDPDRLRGGSGGDPEAPGYLTPVFFRPEVLDRYRRDPVFFVTEREIRCGSSWRLSIDNVYSDRVMVYLGDLGRYLPSFERQHFLANEVSPVGHRIAAEVVAADLLGLWTERTEGVVSQFFRALDRLKQSWCQRFGVELYRELHDDDLYLLQQIHIPSTRSQEEFDSIVQSLQRLLIEYIDESQFSAVKGSDSGSLNRMERFLKVNNINIDMIPLRQLQNLRSRGTAHAKGRKYDKLKKEVLSGNSIEDVKKIISSLTGFMSRLSKEIEVVACKS